MKQCILIPLIFLSLFIKAQSLAPTPPMGFMSWNYFADNLHEKDLKQIVDAMVDNGLVAVGYNYLFIDDGWQGGRDKQNNIIPDAKKFPDGMKAFADYVHSKGMKLGIYSDAAPLTCAGYTGSLHFEAQDARTFASWGIDYLKYDYCGAPSDQATAIQRYTTMAEALKNSGRAIAFGICEWGKRDPWLWAAKAGGQIWRVSGDVRDKWKAINVGAHPIPEAIDQAGYGILDIVEINVPLASYAGPGHWNDMDMLVTGLYGKKGPSGDLGGIGCTDIEYQSQMSLWSLMAAPLMVSCDVRNMNATTKNILLNKDILAIDQDVLGKQAQRIVSGKDIDIFVKPLSNGDIAVGILNRSDHSQVFKSDLNSIRLPGKYSCLDIWTKKVTKNVQQLKFQIAAHETKVLRLSKMVD